VQISEPIAQAAITPGAIITDATAWGASDYPDDRSWVHALTAPMIEEIIAAMRTAKARGIASKDITPADFPLPLSAPLLRAMYKELECGPGFSMLSDFPLDGFSEEEIRLAYCGLCCHFGHITVQNRDREFILEVMDKGKAFDSQQRGYHSPAFLDFHTDGTNTVTLLCVQTALEGGRSKLMSAAAAYNCVVRERADLLEVFHRGFHHHRRDQRIADQPAVTEYRTPVFGFFNGLLHVSYTDVSIRFCAKEGTIITTQETEALDFLKQVGSRPELHVTMELRKGDLQFVNNFLALHSRTAYVNGPDQERRLLRLWLDDENSARLGPGKMDWYMPEHSRFTRIGGLQALAR
jgi:hypothetical protein